MNDGLALLIVMCTPFVLLAVGGVLYEIISAAADRREQERGR